MGSKEFIAKSRNNANEVRKARKKAKRELKKVEADGQQIYTDAIKHGHKLQSQLQGVINHAPFIARLGIAIKIIFGVWK